MAPGSYSSAWLGQGLCNLQNGKYLFSGPFQRGKKNPPKLSLPALEFRSPEVGTLGKMKDFRMSRGNEAHEKSEKEPPRFCRQRTAVIRENLETEKRDLPRPQRFWGAEKTM